jgi:tetratricopeptide (TPR) repeat protein
MLRVHLAQIFFKPAYYDPPNDYIEEPSPYSDSATALGRLRSEDIIQSFLLDSKSLYLEHIRRKLVGITSWSVAHGANVIVYPEYSVPYQALPDLQNLSKKHSVVIVAGTHKVKASDDAKRIYAAIGLGETFVRAGCAIAPVFLSDGSVKAATKLRKSKWEPNLRVGSEAPEIYFTDCGGIPLHFSVIPCIDCLHPEIVGRIFSSSESHPQLIICPSLSPSTEPFKSIGHISALQEVLFAYANTAIYGGTFFNLPAHWHPYLQGNTIDANHLSAECEAILELEVDQHMFFMKRGSVKTAPQCYRPVMYPIVYSKMSEWLPEFDQLYSDIIEFLEAPDIDSAIEWLDSYLAEQAQNMPQPVKQNMTFLRHSVLPLFDENMNTVKKLMYLVRLDGKTDSSLLLFGKLTNDALALLSKFVVDADNKFVDTTLECIRALKRHQTLLPLIPPSADSSQDQAQIQGPIIKTGFTGTENLIESFQGRGNDLDIMRDIFPRTDTIMTVITGAIGIGKSSFVNSLFRKVLTDWEVIRIKVPSDTKFPRILADIAYSIGIPLDIDSLSYCSTKVFEQKVIKVLREFYKCTRRVLVVDDLHQLLAQRNARDFKQLKLFMDRVRSTKEFVGGRIILISSQWLPDNWIRQERIFHYKLKRLPHRFIRRIIEYHMRKSQALTGEQSPDIPQSMIDLVDGHPLSARLLVEALKDQDFRQLSDGVGLAKIHGYIAKELLKYVRVERDDETLLSKFSIFRVPILLDHLSNVDSFKGQQEKLMDLANRCVLGFDGTHLEMHESIRRHFLSKIDSKDALEGYHLSALHYYQTLYKSDAVTFRKDPTVLAELAHHLSQSNQVTELKDIRSLVISEVKPSARKIYREYHDYRKALHLYRLIHEVVPDDIEVTAYLGRCYGRLQHWHDSDKAFEEAICTAQQKNVSYGWIYRDWGHIRARFGYDSIALDHFARASELLPYDPSIKASIAYMYWRQGDSEEAARSLFEEALALNNMHEYTLKFYSRFLDSLGEYEDAEILRNRLYEIEESILVVEPTEYEIEDDFDE